MLSNGSVRYITMLRMNLSPLNAHKKHYKIADTRHSYCKCGHYEDNAHFLLDCQSYALSRSTMMKTVHYLLKETCLTFQGEGSLTSFSMVWKIWMKGKIYLFLMK